MQGGISLLVPSLDLESPGNQDFDNIKPTVGGGKMQGVGGVFTPRSQGRPLFHQQVEQAGVSLDNGQVQGREPVFVTGI